MRGGEEVVNNNDAVVGVGGVSVAAAAAAAAAAVAAVDSIVDITCAPEAEG